MENVLDLMKRMGENLSTCNYWDVRIKEVPIILKEGLITTYDSNIVLKAICKDYNLRIHGIEKNNIISQLKGTEVAYNGDAFLIKNKISEEEIIRIILNTNEDFILSIEKQMKTYGWSLYRVDKNDEGKNEYYFEKLFPFLFLTKHLLQFTNFIYHVAPINIKDKILRQGLIPKESKTPGFKNEPRVYFMINYDDAIEYSFETQRDNIIIKIDLNNLNPEHKFYIDSRMVDTLFSREPIPPTAIEII